MTKGKIWSTRWQRVRRSRKHRRRRLLMLLLAAVKESLKKGDRVTVTGFGTFSVVQRKARTGRIPANGKGD